MNLFEERFNVLLTEMPYLVLNIDGRQVEFDLELEKYGRDWNGIVNLFYDILFSNKPMKDKYGGELLLSTDREKVAFVEELRSIPQIEMFLMKYYKKTLDDLLFAARGREKGTP